MRLHPIAIAAGIFCAACTVAGAAVSYSPPIGGMTISVPSGQTRSVALPLLHAPVGVGAVLGRISGAGSNYLDATGANWAPGGFSSAANPYYVRIKSGDMAGRFLLVSTTANTDSRIYVNNDGIDLAATGVADGDAYEVVLADTLSSLFGSTTLQGGPDAISADNVLVWGNTAWVTYYYNTNRSRWERSTDSAASPSRDDFVLRPDRGLMITRRAATELKLQVMGRVSEVGASVAHTRPGVTFLSTGLPVDITLGALAMHQRTPGWVPAANGPAAATADQVQVWSNTAWISYYYDSVRSSWQRTTDIGASPSRDGVVIPGGRPLMLRRVNAASGVDRLANLPKNYTIDQ